MLKTIMIKPLNDEERLFIVYETDNIFIKDNKLEFVGGKEELKYKIVSKLSEVKSIFISERRLKEKLKEILSEDEIITLKPHTSNKTYYIRTLIKTAIERYEINTKPTESDLNAYSELMSKREVYSFGVETSRYIRRRE